MKRKERTSTVSILNWYIGVSWVFRSRRWHQWVRIAYLLSILKVENQYRPDLSVDLLENESKPVLCNLDSSPSLFDQSAYLQ